MKGGFADIHSHILFGVDDGARSVDESLRMLEMAHSEGVEMMFATPHYGIENGYAPSAQTIRDNYEALVNRAQSEFPNIKLFLGSELYCAPGEVLRRVEQGEALSMAGTRYLLLEFLEWGGHRESAEHICQCMIEIAKTQWIPILAHAQRYHSFEGKQDLYQKMVAEGVYLQINAYDLVDRPDGWTKDNTRWLVTNRLAHFIGTDAHRADRRQPVMRSGTAYLFDNCKEEYATALVRDNAMKMISGEPICL